MGLGMVLGNQGHQQLVRGLYPPCILLTDSMSMTSMGSLTYTQDTHPAIAA